MGYLPFCFGELSGNAYFFGNIIIVSGSVTGPLLLFVSFLAALFLDNLLVFISLLYLIKSVLVVCSEFQLIHELCLYVLSAASQRTELIRATLATLHAFLSWIPLGYIFESPLVRIFAAHAWVQFSIGKLVGNLLAPGV